MFVFLKPKICVSHWHKNVIGMQKCNQCCKMSSAPKTIYWGSLTLLNLCLGLHLDNTRFISKHVTKFYSSNISTFTPQNSIITHKNCSLVKNKNLQNTLIKKLKFKLTSFLHFLCNSESQNEYIQYTRRKHNGAHFPQEYQMKNSILMTQSSL